MTLPLTSLYAALLTLMMLGLATSVIAKRAATGISILHGDNMELALTTRRFGNFIEYVPAGLLLMALMELQSASPLWLNATGGVLLAGRILHAFGLDAKNPKAPLRIIGGSLTLLSLALATFWLLKARFS